MTKVARVDLAYDDVGSSTEAVVLLHGFPLNRSMWREQVAVLREKYRVITPDLRGHGETTAASPSATMEEMAEDVVALLDQLQVERPVVVGISMGGYVTLALYRQYPDRVRGLVLADTRPQADTPEGRKTREETAQRALREGMQPIADAMLGKLLASQTFEQNKAIAERVSQMVFSNDPNGAAAALRGMAVRNDQTAFLEKILVPTLILVGSEDSITPPSDSESMGQRIPDAQIEIIDGAGHLSNIERPDQFNRALMRFLDGLPA